MCFQIDEYIKNFDVETIDQFRSLFLEASDRQLDIINETYDGAPEPIKDIIYDDGVRASFVRKMGEELCLTSLFHLFEIKIKEVIRYKKDDLDLNLSRWDEIKANLPDSVKSCVEFGSINKLRVLVNCFKHSGIVSADLHKIDPSFGDVGSEISSLPSDLYSYFKNSAVKVIESAAQS